MMIATFNPTYSTVNEVKRDSLCSVVSINSAFSLEYLENPNDIIAELDFDEDTDLASNESSPMKDKHLSLDFDEDGELKSRKRRASHRQAPSFRDEIMGDSVTNLFEEENYLPPSLEAEIMQMEKNINHRRQSQQDGEEILMLIPIESQEADEIETKTNEDDYPSDFERARTLSAERRRIQTELLSRLECLDGIQIEVEPEPPRIEYDNNNNVIDQGNNEPRLGIYTEKQRIDRINAYREKRKQRVYGKVRYVLRQRVSETRPRVKGRFVKQTDPSTISSPPTEQTYTSPESILDNRSSTESPRTPISTGSNNRKVEFRMDDIQTSKESPASKRGRSAWDLFKSLSLLSPIGRGKGNNQKRPSLPITWSQKLFERRRQSTTAASTASGRARRKYSRDEFLYDNEDDEDEQQQSVVMSPKIVVHNGPERKRATSMKWSHQ